MSNNGKKYYSSDSDCEDWQHDSIQECLQLSFDCGELEHGENTIYSGVVNVKPAGYYLPNLEDAMADKAYSILGEAGNLFEVPFPYDFQVFMENAVNDWFKLQRSEPTYGLIENIKQIKLDVLIDEEKGEFEYSVIGEELP